MKSAAVLGVKWVLTTDSCCLVSKDNQKTFSRAVGPLHLNGFTTQVHRLAHRGPSNTSLLGYLLLLRYLLNYLFDKSNLLLFLGYLYVETQTGTHQ